MLLRFGVSNYYSIRDYQELSLTASKAIKDEGPALLTSPTVRQEIVPVALIYGANASGKSSLWVAMRDFKRRIMQSFKNSDAEAPIPRAFFRLDPNAKDEPSRFDCDFVLDDVRYHYGFEFSDRRFEREWLFSFPEGNKRQLFSRNSEDESISFGKHLKGKNRFIETTLLRDNALYLSAAAQASHPQLTPIYEYFRNQFILVAPAVGAPDVKEEFDPRVVAFLSVADTGIVGSRIERHAADEETKKKFAALTQALSNFIEASLEEINQDPGDRVEVFMGHRTAAGDTVDIELQNESQGTIRLLSMLPRIYNALDTGATLIIDELDASLHTLICDEIIGLFSSRVTNPRSAQLIATTHDTNLICSNKIRRDQIWFVEKDSGGCSHIYPLTDIRTRNTDNLERGYLRGRFGAIPYFGSTEELLGA